MQQQNIKSFTLYYFFTVCLFLGLFIYCGWIISKKNNSSKPESVKPISQTKLSLQAQEKQGLQLKPQSNDLTSIPVLSVVTENVPKSIVAKPNIIKIKKINKISAFKIDRQIVKNNPEESQLVAPSAVIPERKKKLSLPDFTSYIVRCHDTLTGIAKHQLGSAKRWREIARLNADLLPDPHRLRVGQRLRLPYRGRQTSRSSTGKLYQVKETDSLYSLAVRFYGTPTAINILREANQDKLAQSGNISQGMVLQIPLSSMLIKRTASVPGSSLGQIKYKLKSGDTLSEIAKRFYNKSSLYKKILQANPKIDNPADLKTGMVIIIPEKP